MKSAGDGLQNHDHGRQNGDGCDPSALSDGLLSDGLSVMRMIHFNLLLPFRLDTARNKSLQRFFRGRMRKALLQKPFQWSVFKGIL